MDRAMTGNWSIKNEDLLTVSEVMPTNIPRKIALFLLWVYSFRQ